MPSAVSHNAPRMRPLSSSYDHIRAGIKNPCFTPSVHQILLSSIILTGHLSDLRILVLILDSQTLYNLEH